MLSKSSNMFEENLNIYQYFSLLMTNTQIGITFLEKIGSEIGRVAPLSNHQIA